MKRNSLRRLPLAMLCMLCSSVSMASDWYYALGMGGAFPSIARQARVNNNSGFPPPNIYDLYSTNISRHVTALGEIGKYYRDWVPHIRGMALGLQYQHMFTDDIGKHIVLYSAPNFFNYHYQLDVSSNLLLVNARFDLINMNQFTPYLGIGAGLEQLVVSGYNEGPEPNVTARTSPDFRRNTEYNFAYQFSAGLSYKLCPDTDLSFTYLYQHIGKVETENGTGSWSDRALGFGNSHVNSFFITLTRAFAG